MFLNVETVYCASALRKLSFSRSEIAILVLGKNSLLSASSNYVPDHTKDLIKKFTKEQEKEEKTKDPLDKKLHRIQAELLYFIIKGQLDEYIKIFEEAESVIDVNRKELEELQQRANKFREKP
jgi:mevalonate kinase